MNDTPRIDFEFECVDLPDPVSPEYAHLRLGIQAQIDVHQDVPCTLGQARFQFALEVVLNQANNAVLFRGSYVHGPRGKQFVYLCWGERRDGQWNTLRRAKVPLTPLAPGTIATALRTHQPIRARITMTTAQGAPVAASLKPDYIEWL